MIVSIIITLIVALILIALFVSAIQQHKEKQELARRKELTKQKVILDETEEVLINNANIPLSEQLLSVLKRRIYQSLKTMVENSTNSRALKERFNEAKENLSANTPGTAPETLTLPSSDKQLIGLIQGIKKLRMILRSEHSKGRVDSQVFVLEDRQLEKFQLRINIESQIKRGVSAKAANMVGSARQYFEKAQATLGTVSFSDEYVVTKRQEVEAHLEEISAELKASNANRLQKKTEQEQDDLDILFAPKKKW